MGMTKLAGLLAACLAFPIVLSSVPVRADPPPAKVLFGGAKAPAAMPSRSIGSYAKGCLAGAVELPLNGPDWQGMRPSRNRHWGNPVLVQFIKVFARDAKKNGWPGLLIGDLSQPRGGPMLTGHASHQIGLDADIWLDPAPNRPFSTTEREELSATSVVATRSEVNRNIWSSDHAKLIKLAASYPQVGRIFVNPAIKKALCEWAGTDRAWLNKVRPIYGHNYHFHIRLKCPAGSVGCKDQAPPPPGDGCGENLAWWLSDKPYAKPGKAPTPPAKPPRPMALSDLPNACATVLQAPAP
ncbi:penicillin-insensitive murein endopeptidase [Rhodoligotrophos appendicifer]|uniref:penicillin-insensitive murein endopeptidase n=1 Tax=Rhodoligotrophos appendicifer TaxID=987056 RepID=UPI001186B64B|nr:penicillin-insensitive murein endopeptidase [Rhodoligotrophos appendicifer]